MAFSITSLLSYFDNENKSITRGENHYKSSHVESLIYDPEGVLRGCVHASMKSKTYNVMVYLDENKAIKKTSCECPRGKFKCSHAAALFIHAIHNVSVTDTECIWKKKSKTKNEHQPIAEMFVNEKANNYKPLLRTPNADDKSFFADSLLRYGKFTGLSWLLSPEPKSAENHLVPVVEKIINSEEFISITLEENQLILFKEKMRTDPQIIVKVANVTAGQRDNPNWQCIRKGRLTSSNFGHVLQAKKVTSSLIKKIMGEFNLSGVKAVMWGVHNEGEGIKTLELFKNIKVIETGIWLSESGVIGTSPDGLVGDDYVVEIKCPFSQRDKTIEESLTDKSFYLYKEGDDIKVKQNHPYWHQIQGQLYLTNRSICYFVVWTRNWSCILEILKDPSWQSNLKVLEDFYFKELYPRMINAEL